MSLGWIYKLKPIRQIEPHWYHLRWKPIKNGTWNAYFSKTFDGFRCLSFTCSMDGVHNGWGRGWDDWGCTVNLWWIRFDFWIRWNIHVMDKGPQDVADEDKLGLDLSSFNA